MDSDQKNFLTTPALICADVEHVIDYHLDGEMISPLRERFDAHLETCPECLQMVRECELLRDVARSLRERPIDPGVSLRLRAALKERVGYDLHPGRSNPRLTVVK